MARSVSVLDEGGVSSLTLDENARAALREVRGMLVANGGEGSEAVAELDRAVHFLFGSVSDSEGESDSGSSAERGLRNLMKGGAGLEESSPVGLSLRQRRHRNRLRQREQHRRMDLYLSKQESKDADAIADEVLGRGRHGQ